MPQLLFRGITQEVVAKTSKGLVDELTEIIGCPRDYFTLECCFSQFISDGEAVAGTPLVQVNWFDRGQETQDRAAQSVTRHLRDAGCQNVDVYFVALKTNCYYENGEHF
jgi:hypothetical protein